MDNLKDLQDEIEALRRAKEKLEDENRELVIRIGKMQDAGYEIYQM